jgi:hypothetical protein
MRTTFLASCAPAVLVVAALSLAACQNPNNANSNQAMADSSAPLAPPVAAESAAAPAGQALPSAPPARVNYAPPARRYHYLDEADSMSQAYADAPPDYAFDYDGQAPQAWGSGQGVVRVGERVPGGYRYYYYQPGSDQPYLVRDPNYAYGYDNGELAVVYDSHGRQLDQAYADRQADLAGRYYARARALRQAALRNQRHEVAEQVWRDQAAEQDRQRAEWDRTRQQDADWRAYHDQNARQDQSRWVAVAAAWATAQALNDPSARPGATVTRARAAGRVLNTRPKRQRSNLRPARTAMATAVANRAADRKARRPPAPIRPRTRTAVAASPLRGEPATSIKTAAATIVALPRRKPRLQLHKPPRRARAWDPMSAAIRRDAAIAALRLRKLRRRSPARRPSAMATRADMTIAALRPRKARRRSRRLIL